MATDPQPVNRQTFTRALKAARAEHAGLLEELPQFRALHDEHRARVDALRARRASPEELATASGQLSTARELLSQVESDIAGAAAEVAALEIDLARLGTCEKIRGIYEQVEARRYGWHDEMLQVANSLVAVAVSLGQERRDLSTLYDEAAELRRGLVAGIDPGDVRAELERLNILEPQTLRDFPPQNWMLRNAVAPVESPVVNRAVTVLEDLAGLRTPNLEYLRVRLKQR